MKNYFSQTNIEYIENNNTKEEHLGKKNLHLNRRGNTILANNLLKFLRSNFRDVEFLNWFLESEEYKSERLDISSDDPSFSSLKSVRRKNLHQILFAHLNINSLRNRFDALVDHIKRNVGILVISETKLDESFPEGQFEIPGFTSPFPQDRNEFGGELWLL